MQIEELARRGIRFTRRQTPAFKLMLVRRVLHGVTFGLSNQFDSIYATLLGASATQLGSLSSVGNAVGALAALPTGWFIDYVSLRKIFLLGTGLLLASRFFYFSAPSWTWLYVGIILYYLGQRITCTSCSVTCAAELSNEERATGRGLCRTLASPVALVMPLLAAWLVSRWGGIEVSGIRPLYLVQIAITVILFVLLAIKLTDGRAAATAPRGSMPLAGFGEIFSQGPDVLRLMLLMGLVELPLTLTQPFAPVYAHEFKGANEFVLSAMVMARTLVPMIASVPLGRLADRRGRKRLLFAIAPLSYAGYLCLVLAPAGGLSSSLVLVLFGVLLGFSSISIALASSMVADIMPRDQMGRWLGMISLVRGLMAIPAPLIGGLIWEHAGPQYVFLSAIGIDVALRLPLLALIRETLHARDEEPPPIPCSDCRGGPDCPGCPEGGE